MFNPHSNIWLSNKFEIYKKLREQNTAYWSEEFKLYIITRYKDVVFALKNPEIFSSAKGNLIFEKPERFGKTIGASDNPLHDIYKSAVIGAYSKNNIERVVKSVTHEIESLLANKSFLNISEVIEQISSWCITELIDLPHDKREIKNLIFNTQKYSLASVLNPCPDIDYDTRASGANLEIIIRELIKEKIPSTGFGIYHEYMNADQEGKVPSVFKNPILSGATSLISALQFLTIDLYRQDQLKKIINNPELIPDAVNESLRFHASTGRFSRTVISPVTIHNVNLNLEDRVVLCLESANRDPEEFENPDEFIIGRKSKPLTFGYGVHACFAAALSKSVMISYLEILIKHFGLYTLEIGDKYRMTLGGTNDIIEEIYIKKSDQNSMKILNNLLDFK
jgi:cytochrome P450